MHTSEALPPLRGIPATSSTGDKRMPLGSGGQKVDWDILVNLGLTATTKLWPAALKYTVEIKKDVVCVGTL